MFRLVFIVVFFCFVNFGICLVNLADVQCGVDVARRGRIVGGVDSLPAEFPWAASVWRQGTHQCGATVVSDRWLVTAGHCVCSAFGEYYKSHQLTVVTGYTDIGGLKGDNVPISKILPHPDYRCNKKTNDIALLKTARKLKWGGDLQPACLPKPTASDFDGELAIVAGWGFTNEDRGKGSRPNILQKTEVAIVGNSECSKWYQSQGSKVTIVSTQMCAGHEEGGRDSCWADSGGPLMIREDKIHSTLVGVVSTGSGCARARMPGIYTRVSKYTNWIIENISVENQKDGLRWYPRLG